MIFTEADFENISWHDNHIYGISINSENLESDLIFDIDFITEWICGTDTRVQFLVAAATLVFHDVTDLKINMDWGETNFQVILNEMTVNEITRERVLEQLICLEKLYYKWIISVRFPNGLGEISFGASGFTQTLRQTPILCDEQKLSYSQRQKLFEILKK